MPPRASTRLYPLALGACLALTSCGGGGYESLPTAPPVVPPTGQAPFTPGPGDLPHAAGLYPYAAPSLLQLTLAYQSTPVSGAGWYQVDKNTCQQLPAPPASYPGGMVTLDTVNLDEGQDDNCTPEIKVLATSGDSLIKGAAAKVRLRGSSTRLAELKSYRVKFSDKTTTWWGEDTWQLNKHPYDLTRVRNKLAFDLMRQVPYHESLRTQFVQIGYTDGSGATQPLGLFTHVEKMDKSYLQRRGWVAGSNLYKMENFNFGSDARLAVDAAGKAGPDFEKVMEIEVDSGNHKAIVAAVAALNDDSQPFDATFAHYFDRNNYLAWFATTILLGNWDTRTQNFGLYQPLGSEKFYFVPWDYDAALGFAQQPGENSYPQWAFGIGNWWDSPLHRRFLTTPGAVALLQAAVQQEREKYLTDAAVKQLLDSYRPIVEPILANAPDATNLAINGTATTAQQQWAAEYQRLQTVIGRNYDSFMDSLQRPLPFWIGTSDQAGALQLDWSWPAPFHPQGKPIGYRVELARADPGQPAFAAATLLPAPPPEAGRTALNLGALPAGQYLVRISASDPDGHSTTAFDEVLWGGQHVAGTACVQMPGATRC